MKKTTTTTSISKTKYFFYAFFFKGKQRRRRDTSKERKVFDRIFQRSINKCHPMFIKKITIYNKVFLVLEGKRREIQKENEIEKKDNKGKKCQSVFLFFFSYSFHIFFHNRRKQKNNNIIKKENKHNNIPDKIQKKGIKEELCLLQCDGIFNKTSSILRQSFFLVFFLILFSWRICI